MLNLPFLTAEIASLPAHQGTACPTKTAYRFTTLSLGLLAIGIVTLTGCQNRAAKEEADMATPTPTLTKAPPTVSEPTTPATQTDAVDKAPSEVPVAAAPNVTNSAQLPQALVKQWEPLSNVLFEFGAMSITPSAISWNSGQSSAYSVVDTSNGYLLKLDAAPQFFDTTHPYIKLIPQQGSSGSVSEVEVAFYEDQQKAESDEYIMFGTYVVK